MIFEFVRQLFCPFNKIETFIPKKGQTLDVGCGHGTFARILAKESRRKVLGIDPSSKKIQLAKSNSKGFSNLMFQKAYIQNLENLKFNCISIIDVLYLVPTKEKIKILKKAKSLLKERGKLIVCEVYTKPKWMFKLVELEEKLMVKLLRYTYTSYTNLYFMEEDDYLDLLNNTGYKITSITKISSTFHYPNHLLFVATPIYNRTNDPSRSKKNRSR